MAPQFLRSAPAIAVSSLSSNVSSRKPSLGWSMASKHSTAMAWISRKMPAYSRDDAGLTIVVKAAPCVPTFMRAADDTVALRASASPVVQALIRACGSPLACTSANTHGAPSPASFAAVEGRILEGVDVAVDAGETPCRDASTIVSFQHGGLQILRQGALPASEIERVLSDPMQ